MLPQAAREEELAKQAAEATEGLPSPPPISGDEEEGPETEVPEMEMSRKSLDGEHVW